MKLLKEKIVEASGDLESVMFVIDHASIHVSKDAKEKLKEINIQCMTICPYSPCQNPIEKVIGAIKSSWRKKIYSKYAKMNAGKFMQIAQNLKRSTINEWVYKSKLETISQLKFYLD